MSTGPRAVTPPDVVTAGEAAAEVLSSSGTDLEPGTDGSDRHRRGCAVTPWSLRGEVEDVVADLLYWRRLGVVVLTVEPLEGHGARIGVHHPQPLVTQAIRARYAFPVECWEAPMVGAEHHVGGPARRPLAAPGAPA